MEQTPIPERVKSTICIKNANVTKQLAADLLWCVRPYLCSIDELPRTEQTEAMLVAVVETSAIYFPVCAVISLFNK